MGQIIDMPTTARIKELEQELEENEAKIESLEKKMNLCCRSSISISGNTKEGLFSLHARSMAIAKEIGRLRGFDEEKWFEEYTKNIEAHEKHLLNMFKNELTAIPDDVEEKRMYLYKCAEEYLLQTKMALEKGSSYEEIYDEWDKFAFFHELVMDYDDPVFQDLNEDELVTCAELDRLEELSLYELCNEMLGKYKEKEEKLASNEKRRYIGEIFVYYRATLHAIDDKRLK